MNKIHAQQPNNSKMVLRTQQNQKTQKPQQKDEYYLIRGLIGCFGGFLILLVVGSLYQWGIISIYVTSYYKSLDPSVTLQSTAIAFPLMMFCMGIGIGLGVTFSQKTHPIFAIGVTQTISAGVTFASSFVSDIWVFIVLFGILFGLSAGSNIMIPVVQCNKYFPGKKMYVNGVILIGIGLGSLVFGLFSYNFINPMKIPPQNGYYLGSEELQQIANRLPQLVRWLSLLYIAISIIGLVLISPVCLYNSKKAAEIKQNNNNNNNNQQNNLNLKKHQANSLTQVFCSKICWIQVLIIILANCGIFLINGNYKTYVKNTINDDQFLTIIGVVGSIGNGCTRFFWNLLFSKTGYKFVTLLNLTICIIIFSTIRFTVQNKAVYLIQVFLANSCIGGTMVTIPTLSQILYGQIIGSKVYGFFWNCVATTNFIQFAYVKGLSPEIGFDNVIYICLGMCILAIPIVIFTKFQGPWENDTTTLEFLVSYEVKKQKEEKESKQKTPDLNKNNEIRLVCASGSKEKVVLPPINLSNSKKKIGQENSETKLNVKN